MSDLTLVHAGRAPRGSAAAPEPWMPMGCLYLTAALQRAGYEVDFRDYQFAECDEPRDPSALADCFAGCSDVVGISCLVDFLPVVILACERLKRLRPETTIVLGGPGPSDCPERLIERFPWIDIVVVGEGELTLLELVDRLRRPGPRRIEDVDGLVFRHEGRPRATRARARIRDLDTLGFPHPAGVDLSRYAQATLITSRGCPYACAFCDVTELWDRHTTYRSVDNVVEEMRALGELGFQEVSIQDDNFTLDRRRVEAFCSRTRALPGAPGWACLARVDLVDRELLSEMKGAGCRGIFFGVESGSDRVLAQIGKHITARASCRAVEAAAESLAGIKCYFIWGFPDETASDFMQTLLLAAYCGSLGAATPLSLLSPLPRSGLYARHQHEVCLDPRLAPFNFVGGGLLEHLHPEVLALVRSQPDLFPSFYTYPSPDLETKLALMSRFKPINDLTLMRGAEC